jgi:hypothetical protein
MQDTGICVSALRPERHTPGPAFAGPGEGIESQAPGVRPDPFLYDDQNAAESENSTVDPEIDEPFLVEEKFGLR